MARYDLVIQLGSQVKYSPAGGYQLALHTAMRTQASAIAIKKGIAQNLMISGGSNFGVRYDDQQLLKSANFSFSAFADADFTRESEATVIKDFLVNEYGVESDRVFAETLSSTTEENAAFVAILLKRRPAFTGDEKIAILTLLYHMEKALPVFIKAGLNVEALFAENVLADQEPVWVEKICEYYSTPKGGNQYPVNEIRRLLTEGKSLKELIAPWWYITVIDSSICADGEPSELEKHHMYFARATTKEKATTRLREEHGLTVSDLEKLIKGPFETLEQARKDFRLAHQ